MRHRLTVAAIPCVALLLITACGGAKPTGTATNGTGSASGPKRGGSIVAAIPKDPSGLNPYESADGGTEEIVANIFEGLLKVDAQGNLQAGLADDWKLDPDGKGITFHLREAYFHNGRKVGPEDVKFSLEHILDPAAKHPRVSDYKPIDKVTVVDASTVKVTLSQPSGAILYDLATAYAGIFPKEAVADLKLKPVGAGPFQFVDWVPGDHVTLKRFDRYYQSAPLDQVTFKVLPDANQQLLALQQGQIDIIPRLSAEQAPQVKADKRLQLLSGPQNLVHLVAFNTARPPLNDVRVRHALSYAIDRKAIIDGAAGGLGIAIGSHLTPSISYYTDLTGTYPYDPAKAKALLADAGLANGFTVTIRVPESYAIHRRTGEIVAEQLGKVGIKAKLDVVEWGRWLTEVYKGRDYDITVIGHTGRLDPDAIMNRYDSHSPSNYMNLKDAEVDRLLAAGAAEPEPAKRKPIYDTLQQRLADLAPAYFIEDPAQLVAMRADVQGYEIYPIYIDYFAKVWRSS